MSRITAIYTERYGFRVQHGPFGGMDYVREAHCSMLLPKLIGSYEAELHPALEKLLKKGYATVVDIGSAEGYYAIGLALRLPQAHVYAYEMDCDVRCHCAELAALNEVSNRLTLAGACDVSALQSLPMRGALIVCDCEGAELELLRPDLIAGMRECDLIVELHDCFNPTTSTEIAGRFTGTHDVELVSSVRRNPGEYLAPGLLTASEMDLAVNEIRPEMQWAVMTSRSTFQPAHEIGASVLS